MQLIKWEPLNEVERLFENLSTPLSVRPSWDMAVDLYEEKGKMIAKMSLPGIDPEKINVSVQNNMLRVAGSREEEKEVKDKHYYSKEIRRGEFERSVRLPKNVNNKNVEAEYKDGTLHVHMPIIKNEKDTYVQVKIKK